MAVRPVSFTSIREQLVNGPSAFYNQPDYLERTRADLASDKVLPTAYQWNTESRAKRIAKIVLAIIIFPIGIYRVLHGLAGFVVLPSSLLSLDPKQRSRLNQARSAALEDSFRYGDWRYKRLTIEVDGCKIDAVIAGKPQNLSNGRWVLAAGGNGEFYEDQLRYGRAKDLAGFMDANVLLFNYPSVMCSTGVLPSRKAMEKSMRAMNRFLEDKEKGIGATDVVMLGHSIGGGALADTLENHKFDPSVRRARQCLRPPYREIT